MTQAKPAASVVAVGLSTLFPHGPYPSPLSSPISTCFLPARPHRSYDPSRYRDDPYDDRSMEVGWRQVVAEEKRSERMGERRAAGEGRGGEGRGRGARG